MIDFLSRFTNGAMLRTVLYLLVTLAWILFGDVSSVIPAYIAF